MAVQPGAASRHADSVYNRDAPGVRDGAYAYVSASGYSSNEERLVDQALQAASIPSEVIRAGGMNTRQLFPPKWVGERTQPGIEDVVEVDRRYPDSSAQFSGQSGSYSGSSGPSLGWW